MKMKQFIVTTVMTSGLLAGASTPALADNGDLCNKGGKHAAYKDHKRGARPMQRLMEKLDMEQAQREQVEKIVTSRHDAMQEQRQAMRDIREKLRQIVTSDEYDAAKVKQLAEQKARLAGEMTLQRTRMMHNIYQQLTPEQQKKLQAMRGQHRHHKS
ncbi:Spy/CpxP family protein refolding chaperone [Thiohalophilus sp.]|uniref:Spy/CpxP family protein refolding chaperone n=1 Tax=Thiohalophilus sp. TaxID=3028392 RepID=UPI002ACD3F2D|nr:Spy/CpxP family protein refolding chaperone [Thiohalophilus sp.]MDZ7661161.1 Spy/CpxP family protein refolding chaperone [Thiohalophilus sp.]